LWKWTNSEAFLVAGEKVV